MELPADTSWELARAHGLVPVVLATDQVPDGRGMFAGCGKRAEREALSSCCYTVLHRAAPLVSA